MEGVDPSCQSLDPCETQLDGRAADWELLVLRLVCYADGQIRLRYWRTPSGVLPKGHASEDIAFGAIKKLLTRERRWNPDRHPDLLGFLMDVVDSEISHLVYSSEHRRRVSLSDRDRPEDPLDQIPSGRASQLDELEADELRRRIRQCVTDDPQLESVALLLMEGYKPREIAEKLELPISEIYALTRKMRRRILSLVGRC